MAHNMMTSGVGPTTKAGLDFRPIEEASEAFEPIPSVLLNSVQEPSPSAADHEPREAFNDQPDRHTLAQDAIDDQLDTNDTYRVLVDTVKDYAIFMLDTNGNVRTWNAGAQLLKGYKPEEIIGKHFSIFYGEDDIIGEKPRKELEICLRDGKVEVSTFNYTSFNPESSSYLVTAANTA